ncbi:hypothetical protein FXO38_26108 [Capsicum annuum]|nr:hypothetical protein FXO38_26108 [Capsicum annuum]
MTTSYYGMIEEVRLMLINSDTTSATEVVDLVKCYEYKVTMIGTTSAAMTILSKGKEKIDVMIINVHSLNLFSFEHLAQAVNLDIISLVISDEHDELFAKKARDNGAYLYIKKPFDGGILKYLWQFVLREKMQRVKVGEGPMHVEDIGNNIIHEAENDVGSNGKYKLKRKRGRKNLIETNVGETQRSNVNKAVRQKVCIEWTDYLHGKFMKAARQLGEGNCYPKNILEVMCVPNLTRMQVASHLQKCRTNNWRVLGEQKYVPHSSGQESSSGSQQPSFFKKFGIVPRLHTCVSNLQRNPNQVERGPEFLFPTLSTSNIFSRGESSIQKFYHPQFQVQPHHLTFGNSFNNPFFPVQNNIGGGIQQYGPFFGMPGSQGLQSPIIGNINYMPNLEFNRGSHHTQSIYILDLNNMANHNLGPPSATLPNEQGRGFDQVYFDDLVSNST